jgi:aminodeoxyfutalosine synthase
MGMAAGILHGVAKLGGMPLPLPDLEKRAVAHGIGGIPTKVRAQTRLTDEDCLAMYQTKDLALLGLLANEVRERMHGQVAYYNVNVHLNYTNWCNRFCGFCAFQRRPGDEGAYCYSPEEVEQFIRDTNPEATEVHMVGGVWPALGYEYFLDILRAAKRGRPEIHVKAYTMVEIDEIVRLSKKSLAEVLTDLKEAGLDSMPGGGAEIFSERLRAELYPKKMGAERWLELAEGIHKEGFRTNCTMLYGMTETLEERVDHLSRLRTLQDKTGGFQTYIPLAFHPDNTPELSHLPYPGPTQRLRSIAIGRLYLDNVTHIKAYWIMLGLPVAQLALTFGADDLDGTVTQEKVYHDAGAATPEKLERTDLHQLIREAGRIPVERDTLYQSLQSYPDLIEGEFAVQTNPIPV